MNATSANPPPRLNSLDQFRGYTMFGMLLVNLLGGYVICPPILKHHHDYCSYADTIMPQFLFAAGFAMRLSLSRRIASGGRMPWGRVIRRILGLVLISVAWYSFCDARELFHQFQTEPLLDVLGRQLKRGWFQTLMHIAITSLWITPVIAASIPIRTTFAVASVLLHILLSWMFNFHWVNTSPNGIDGGPLGFLTWTVPAICGSIAADWVHRFGLASIKRLVFSGLVLMAAAWVISNLSTLYNVPSSLSTNAGEPLPVLADDPVLPREERWQSWRRQLIEPPFVPPPSAKERQWNYWMMSQRSGTFTYTGFASGLSLVLFAIFLKVADGWRWQVGVFRTLGTNSLAAYLLHDISGWIFDPIFPEKTSSPPMAVLAFSLMFLAVWIPCRILEINRWHLRV